MIIKKNFFSWILFLNIVLNGFSCHALEQKPIPQKFSKESLKNFFKQLSIRVNSCGKRPILATSTVFFFTTCLLGVYAYDMKQNYHAERDAYQELFLKNDLCKTYIKTSQRLPDHYPVQIDLQAKEIFYLDNNNKRVRIWSENNGIFPIKDILLQKFFRQHINENSNELISDTTPVKITASVNDQPKQYRLTLSWNDGKKQYTEELETTVSQEEIDDMGLKN